jgi:hypothetical protein
MPKHPITGRKKTVVPVADKYYPKSSAKKKLKPSKSEAVVQGYWVQPHTRKKRSNGKAKEKKSKT